MTQRLFLTNENNEELAHVASSVLASGGLVIYPTETVYGVGCDGLQAAAVSKMLQYKRRPVGKAISVLVANQEEAEKLVEINETAQGLFQAFLPGPVTVVCTDKGVVDERLTSELGTLGIRISSHPFAALLAEVYGKPITSTSANSAGDARPYAIDDLLSRLSPQQQAAVDLIIDAGVLPKREPSTVIDTTTPVQSVLRAGAEVELLAPPFESTNEEETKQYAARLTQSFAHVFPEKALIFALEGEMGMGKTRFAQGVAKALGVTHQVSSPSFTLMKEYPGTSVHFLHLDLWRAETITPEELDWDALIKPQTVIVVEWPTPLLKTLKEEHRAVVQRIQFVETGETSRRLSLVSL